LKLKYFDKDYSFYPSLTRVVVFNFTIVNDDLRFVIFKNVMHIILMKRCLRSNLYIKLQNLNIPNKGRSTRFCDQLHDVHNTINPKKPLADELIQQNYISTRHEKLK
jgi:hypothetical protein